GGVLTPIGSVAAGPGLQNQTASVEPSGTFLYISGSGQGVVFMYKIDPQTGLLTPTNPSTVTASSQPYVIAADPTGRFAYVTDYSDVVVSTFTIDSSTGVLHSTGALFEGVVRN